LNKSLEIVNWAVPYPANYGGAIDVFYKLKYLSEEGYKIRLHCFTYNEFSWQEELKKYCTEVIYYQRQPYYKYIFSSLPFIVASRASKDLLTTLLKSDATILLEGAHSTAFLKELQNAGKNIIIRTHNLENLYYKSLAQSEKNIIKRLYYNIEAKRLLEYELNCLNAPTMIHVNSEELSWFEKKYPKTDHYCIPTFQSFNECNSIVGQGDFCLYHGNLAVNENEQAALYLIEHVFSKIETPLIIAGHKPSIELQNAAKQFKNISIISNPSDAALEQLLQEAQINVFHTEQNTGVKIKLLNSLFKGRFVIINDAMVSGNQLEQLCTLCNTPLEYVTSIEKLMLEKFSQELIDNRKTILEEHSNQKKANQLISILEKKSTI
jgi:hypothetical protein